MAWAQDSLGYSKADSYHFAFAVACVSVIVSIIIYFLGRPTYKQVIAPATSKDKAGSKTAETQAEAHEDANDTKERIVCLCLVFAVVIFFWMAFHQNGLTLTWFADEFTATSATGVTGMEFNVLNLVWCIFMMFGICGLITSKKTTKAVVTNLALIVVPAAVLVLAVYGVMGFGLQAPTHIPEVEYMKVIPYIIVLVTAIAGMNVMAVLTMGTILCGVIGIGSHLLGSTSSYDLFGWFSAMGNGIVGMGELVIIAMMAGGMLEIIRENGGINYIIDKITAHVNSKRGAELSIAALVSMVNICTANNTVAILTVGNIAKKIGDKFGVDNRKAASILDTFSCTVQGLIPYGVQMLLAAGLANLSPMDILPYLYYPMAIGVAALLSILLRYPKRYS